MYDINLIEQTSIIKLKQQLTSLKYILSHKYTDAELTNMSSSNITKLQGFARNSEVKDSSKLIAAIKARYSDQILLEKIKKVTDTNSTTFSNLADDAIVLLESHILQNRLVIDTLYDALASWSRVTYELPREYNTTYYLFEDLEAKPWVTD